jgi:hypothetical protein
MPLCIPQVCCVSIPGGFRHSIIISQEEINSLPNAYGQIQYIYTPTKLKPTSALACLHYKQIAMSMVRLMTSETISSCKWLMHNFDTSEMWQTAFRKDFCRMAQGNKKMGQKGITYQIHP